MYLASAAAAEFFASVALCPLEATRIRLVSDPKYATGLVSGVTKIMRNEGVGAFYAGLGPILLKQLVCVLPRDVCRSRLTFLFEDSVHYDQVCGC